MAVHPERTLSRPCLPRRAVDWRHAAALVARGVSLAETAREVGCSRSQLSRRRQHDAVFRGWIEEARRGADEFSELTHGLRRALTDAIRAEVKGGNVRVILWLADRLKLLEPPAERAAPPDQPLRAMLGRLSPAELREFASLRDDDGDGADPAAEDGPEVAAEAAA